MLVQYNRYKNAQPYPINRLQFSEYYLFPAYSLSISALDHIENLYYQQIYQGQRSNYYKQFQLKHLKKNFYRNHFDQLTDSDSTLPEDTIS